MHGMNYCNNSTIWQLAILVLFYQDAHMLALVSISRETCLVSVFGPVEMHGDSFRSRHVVVHAGLMKLV